MAQKRDSMRRQGDQLRRAVVLEPRGHTDMCAALLTEPVSPGAHAGLFFMHADGFTRDVRPRVIAARPLRSSAG